MLDDQTGLAKRIEISRYNRQRAIAIAFAASPCDGSAVSGHHKDWQATA
jgi:hypothetical protein